VENLARTGSKGYNGSSLWSGFHHETCFLGAAKIATSYHLTSPSPSPSYHRLLITITDRNEEVYPMVPPGASNSVMIGARHKEYA